jgi:hypothetical protein
MADERIRRQIALLAARLMYERTESEYFTAKRKAARQLGLEHRTRPRDLPSNAEIRDQIQTLAQCYEGESRAHNLRQMRLTALAIMRLLDAFHPHLIGSVLTGHIRKGSDIDLHIFASTTSAVTNVLEDQQMRFTVERKRVLKHNEERVFTHIHIEGPTNIELTLYPPDTVNYPFRSSITGKLIERASTQALEKMLHEENPADDLEDIAIIGQERFDRFEVFRTLLVPLEKVQQNPSYHPEGDALYHSLQVFELARDRAPYDEEFLLAALLHDVGKAIDSHDHVGAALESLEGVITPRTEFLIRHHMDAHAIQEGTLGHRARQRLEESEDFEELMSLQEIDRLGRQRGMQVCTIDEALEFIRRLEGDEFM